MKINTGPERRLKRVLRAILVSVLPAVLGAAVGGGLGYACSPIRNRPEVTEIVTEENGGTTIRARYRKDNSGKWRLVSGESGWFDGVLLSVDERLTSLELRIHIAAGATAGCVVAVSAFWILMARHRSRRRKQQLPDGGPG